jgi:hypothetical protein
MEEVTTITRLEELERIVQSKTYLKDMKEENKKTTIIEVLERMEKASKTYLEELNWVCANYLETFATEVDETEYEAEKLREQMIDEEKDCQKKLSLELDDIPRFSYRFDKNDLKYLSYLIERTYIEKLDCIDSIKSRFERDDHRIINGKKREVFVSMISQFIRQDMWKYVPRANSDYNPWY